METLYEYEGLTEFVRLGQDGKPTGTLFRLLISETDGEQAFRPEEFHPSTDEHRAKIADWVARHPKE